MSIKRTRRANFEVEIEASKVAKGIASGAKKGYQAIKPRLSRARKRMKSVY